MPTPAKPSKTWLLALPRELRDEIYGYILPRGQDIIISTHKCPDLVNLSLVCMAICDEVRDFYFSSNTFRLDKITKSRRWLRRIGSAGEYLRRVSIGATYRYCTGWVAIFRILVRRAPQLRGLQFGVRLCDEGYWDNVGFIGRLISLPDWVGLARLDWYDDGFIGTMRSFEHLQVIKLVGPHDPKWIDKVCLKTGCRVQGLDTDTIPGRPSEIKVWRDAIPSVILRAGAATETAATETAATETAATR